MPHNLLIVGILTIGLALATGLAYIMQRLKLSPILGYLLAGYIIGPYSPGFVADSEVSQQLAEIGVILMLFVVGLHFKLKDLLRVKSIAIPGAVGQTFLTAFLTTVIVHEMGWSWEVGIIIGFSIGVASTVVLVRILTDNNILNTPQGHIAVGWLVVEDIFTVMILLLLPIFAAISIGEDSSWLDMASSVIFILGKFCVLALFMFTWGHKGIDFILIKVARLRSQELFTLTMLSLVFLIATGSSVIFGTSIALGAFLAGMVIGKTNVKHQAAANALPLKDTFAVIFFLSVGMLFNPMVIGEHFTLFSAILAIILIVKPLIAYGITLSLGYSLNIALTLGVSLAQIGEFSFILAREAIDLNLVTQEIFDLLVVCALISISLNPILFQFIEFFEPLIRKIFFSKKSKRPTKIQQKLENFSSKLIVIGFGPIGKEVAKILQEAGLSPIIIEQNIDTVSRMEKNYTIFFGDATESTILKDAHIEEATHLLITIPDTNQTLKIIHTARHLNPDIHIIARSEYIMDKHLLEKLCVQSVCTENEALGAFTTLTRQLFAVPHA